MAAVAIPLLDACSSTSNLAKPTEGFGGGTAGTSPGTTAPFAGYGALVGPDANGLLLPAGFTSRVIAQTGEAVAGTDYVWPEAPDGGAVFPTDDGWIYVANSEAVPGGASMVRFDRDGTVVEARRILGDTLRNCAGGRTPWDTWLSCEEVPEGRVWECDPTGQTPAEVRDALGVCNHEAAAADPVHEVVYLTEDDPAGGLYRFRPDRWGDLRAGVLEALVTDGDALRWQPVPDPSAAEVPMREQLPNLAAFDGGEGADVADGVLWFSTKGDNRLWRLEPDGDDRVHLSVVWDSAAPNGPAAVADVDNVVVGPNGLPFVAEDGAGLQVVVVAPDGAMHPVATVTDAPGSEITGPAFTPDGTRLYFSSQRSPGRTYEVSGPFA